MKIRQLLLPIFFLFVWTFASAQTLDWVNRYDYSSRGISLQLTPSGNYLLGGIETEFLNDEGILALHQANGDSIWLTNICDPSIFATFLTAFPLDNGQFMAVCQGGDVFLINEDGTIDSRLYNMLTASGITGAVISSYAIRDSQLTLISSASLTLPFQRLHTDINLRNQEITGQYFLSGDETLNHIDYFEDGTLLESLHNPVIAMLELRRFNSDRTIVWEVERSVDSETDITDVVIASNQQIYLVGSVSEGDYPNRVNKGIIIAFDRNGEELWEKRYSPFETEFDPDRRFNRIKENADQQLVLAGSDGNNFETAAFLMKCDLEGDIIWEWAEPIYREYDSVEDFVIDANGDLIICGEAGRSDFGGPERMYLAKVLDQPNSVNGVTHPKEWRVYPTLANQQLHIDLGQQQLDDFEAYLFHVNGAVLGHWNNQSIIPINNLSAGTYGIRIVSGQYSMTQKWVKME